MRERDSLAAMKHTPHDMRHKTRHKTQREDTRRDMRRAMRRKIRHDRRLGPRCRRNARVRLERIGRENPPRETPRGRKGGPTPERGWRGSEP